MVHKISPISIFFLNLFQKTWKIVWYGKLFTKWAGYGFFTTNPYQTKNKCHQNNILIIPTQARDILIIPTRFKNIRGMFFKEVGTTQRVCTCIVQLLVSLVSRYISTLHNYARLCLSFKILLHANVQPVVNYFPCGDSFSWRK